MAAFLKYLNEMNDAYYNQDEATKAAMHDIGIEAFERSLDEMDAGDKLYVDKWFEINNRIHDIMRRRGLLQKDIAEKMGKTEPEISKFLNGLHNFTLRTICALEVALGEPIVYAPQHVPQTPMPNEIH